MKIIFVTLVCLLVPISAGRSGEWTYGEGAQYIQRSDTITLGAGNAKDINAATHIIDPWPRDVGRRRIHFNGERMVGAMQRYLGRQGVRGQGGGAAAGAIPQSDATATGMPPAPPTGAAVPSLR
jgi:hypothetical protein